MGLTIDRMELADLGAEPVKLAAAILKQLPDLSKPIPVREIAAAIDIVEIREEILDGLEGGLIVPDDKSEGAILVHRDRPETRKRYTIAHELGHYVNPWHKSDSPEGFRCRSKDMALERFAPNDRAAKMEVQANQFAAELLMPRTQVDKFLRRIAGADILHVIRMADERFNVSREAAARRYIERSSEPVAVVFSCDGMVRYAKQNDDFPRLSVARGSPLPSESLSANSDAAVGTVTEWLEVRGHAWLTKSAGLTVFEQTLAQRNGYRMTLLTIERDGQDDEEEVEERWKPPSFHR